MPAPRTYFTDDAYCIAFWNNVVLIDVDGDMNAPRMRKLAQAYRELLSAYPHIVAMCLMRQGTPVSGSEARAEAARFTKELGASLVHVAMVIESKGIVAQMLRTVIRGINVLARNTNLTVADNVEGAIRALVPLVVTTSPRQQVSMELKAALTAVRTSFRPEESRADTLG
jgi:hypothetical protein